MAANLSPFLCKMLSDHRYIYDYDDNIEILREVVNCLNGARLTITPDNMDIIHRIGIDLQLECLIIEAEKFGKLCHDNQAKIDCSGDEVDAICALQEAILEVSFENLVDVQAAILESSWVRDRESLKELVLNLIVLGKVRPRNAPVLARLVQSINASLADTFFLDFLERRIRFCLPDSYALAFSLCELGLIRTDLVTLSLFLITEKHIPGLCAPPPLPVDFFSELDAESTNADFALVPTAFFWFLPELERDFPLIVRAFVRQALASHTFPMHAQEIAELQADNWALLRELRRTQQNPDELARALAADDVATASQLLARSAPAELRASPFDNTSSCSPLAYAASRVACACVRAPALALALARRCVCRTAGNGGCDSRR